MRAAAPPQIASACAGLPAAQLQAARAPGDWSACEVLAHLRACADMWGSAIGSILTSEHPTIRAINPRTWIKRTDYQAQEFFSSLAAFRAQRAGLLDVLVSLPAAGWERGATVTGAGRPRELTVRAYAMRLAVHERAHLKQIARIAQGLRAAK